MTGRRIKLLVILAGAALAVLTLASWTQVWISLTIESTQPVEVTGEVAAPALTALALAELALLGALAIAGPFFRVVLSVIEALIGVTIVYAAILAISAPVTASARSVSDATGVAGSDAIAELVTGATLSAWPFLALIAGAGIAIVAIVTIVTTRRWPGSTRKYQSVRLEPAARERTAVDDWDSLSGGDDPTTEAPGAPETPAAPETRSGGDPR